MKILIFGASGFIGSHFLKSALDAGHELAMVTRNESQGHETKNILNIASNHESNSIVEAVRKTGFQPEVIVDFSWSGVLGGKRDSLSQFENVPRIQELLIAAKKLGVQHYVGTGSQAEYGPKADKIREEDCLRPSTAYGAAKAASFLISQNLASAFEIKFTWMRLFSTYGPGDADTWLIPSLAISIMRGDQISLTECQQLWDYLYVDDACEAFLEVVKSDVGCGPLNVASGEVVPLSSVVREVSRIADPRHVLRLGEKPYRINEPMRLEADTTKIQNLTGWRPKTPLLDGLTKTVAFYREAMTRGHH